jgi:hypothetical protein
MPTGARDIARGLAARCNTLNRQAHNRVCSAFVIASPCRNSRQTKTLLTLPSLWTHRTRPQGTWKLQNSFHSANSAHPLFEKDLNPNRREPGVSTVSWDFTTRYFSVPGICSYTVCHVACSKTRVRSG